MVAPLRQIRTWPLYLKAGSAVVESSLLVVGGLSGGELVLKVPGNVGSALGHSREPSRASPSAALVPPYQPGLGAPTSIESAGLRPKVGLPQTKIASLLCSGPLIASPDLNEITLQ